MPNDTAQYLNDGVYAEMDLDSVVLTTGSRYIAEKPYPDNTIFLDDTVLVALLHYLRKHKPKLFPK